MSNVMTLPNGKPHPFAEYPNEPVRKKCAWCGDPMAPLKTGAGYPARSTALAILDKRGHFDTLRCAAAYAVREVEA